MVRILTGNSVADKIAQRFNSQVSAKAITSLSAGGVSHLRRSASVYTGYPALTLRLRSGQARWAKLWRTSGAGELASIGIHSRAIHKAVTGPSPMVLLGLSQWRAVRGPTHTPCLP